MATKFNASQAEALLLYLDTKMDNVIKFCFSKTQKNISNKKSSSCDVAMMMMHAEKSLAFFNSKRVLFKQKQRSKLIPKLEVVATQQAKSLSERSIYWLFQNLEQLSPAPQGLGNFKLNHKNYYVENIQTESLYPETDMYENRVIFSYLHNIKEFLLLVIENHKKGIFIPRENDLKDDNYASFEQLLSKLASPIHERKLAQCNNLLHQCLLLIDFFSKNLPCSLTLGLRPRVTTFVRAHNHYFIAFGLVNEWLDLGEPSWIGEDFLYGLRAISELYEFFCLYKLIESIEACGLALISSEYREYSRQYGFSGYPLVDIQQSSPNNYYKFIDTTGSIFELIEAVARTVRYGYKAPIGETPELIGTLENPIVNIDNHRQFICELFKRRSNLEARSRISFITTNYDTLIPIPISVCESEY